MKDKIKVYLSGPITDADPEKQKENLQKFHDVAKELRDKGYEVVNPAELSELAPGLSYQAYIRVDLREMLMCNAVLMLTGYQESKGAMIEKKVAEMVGISVFTDIAMFESWAVEFLTELREHNRYDDEAMSGSF